VDAVVKTAAAESDDNRVLVAEWARQWSTRAQTALQPVAAAALSDTANAALNDARSELDARLTKAGLA
jgi:phenol hydroxylase P1 protein